MSEVRWSLERMGDINHFWWAMLTYSIIDSLFLFPYFGSSSCSQADVVIGTTFSIIGNYTVLHLSLTGGEIACQVNEDPFQTLASLTSCP